MRTRIITWELSMQSTETVTRNNLARHAETNLHCESASVSKPTKSKTVYKNPNGHLYNIRPISAFTESTRKGLSKTAFATHPFSFAAGWQINSLRHESGEVRNQLKVAPKEPDDIIGSVATLRPGVRACRGRGRLERGSYSEKNRPRKPAGTGTEAEPVERKAN